VAFVFYTPHDKPNGEALMRYVLISLAFLLGASQAQAQIANLGPSPESDLGLASIVMVAAAAFLAYRFRRR
jgi:hypothetical protein